MQPVALLPLALLRRRATRANLRHRRGGIYIVMLSMAMLVSVVSMGGLLAARLQCRAATASCDFATARLCARAGIEMAMYRMRTDPTWRSDLGNGAWYSNVLLGAGRFSVSAADPISGNITLAANHPVVLTATGSANAASYQMQVQVQVDPADSSSVEVSACSGGNFTVANCAIASSQTLSSGGNFNANPNSATTANVEAVGPLQIKGTSSGSQTTIATARVIPSTATALAYYEANATAIPYTALLQSNATQIVANGSFETNVAGWYVYSPSSASVIISRDTAQHSDGAAALLISGRAAPGDVPATDLPLTAIRKGDNYNLKLPVYAVSTGTVQAELVIVSDSGTQTFTTPTVTFPKNGGWSNCQATLTPTWTGLLQKATLTLVCTDNTATLDVDAITLTDTTFGPNGYVMDRVVLSPTQNPYGTANAQGIYWINCNNQAVTIGPCRIVGTLVLTNVGPQVTVQGPIVWETPIAGYPSLMTDNNCTISFNGSVGLSESTFGVNFNPSGTPYPFASGTSNVSATDTYPSMINGLVYCGGNLTLATSPQFNGCVISVGQINAQATNLNLTFNNASYLNPPPGFGTGLPSLKPLPSTWQRVTH